MSSFTFGHNVFKICLLQLRQNASAGGKGLIKQALFINASRAPVAQSVATRAVNPGVVSSNPGSANFLSED